MYFDPCEYFMYAWEHGNSTQQSKFKQKGVQQNLKKNYLFTVL